ncbi:hypothetical protein DICPUDRAFT_153279, partial [Dictyostelium purpureum]
MQDNIETPNKYSSLPSLFNTPVQNPNRNAGNSTPIPNSPFLNALTPVNETKKLYDISSTDALPIPISKEKNVHSPPKLTFSLNEIRLACEKKLLLLKKEDLIKISQITKNKKKKVTQWFFTQWFNSNNDIDQNIILRTVFSVFCSLRKEKQMGEEISKEFQLFWNRLKNERKKIHK